MTIDRRRPRVLGALGAALALLVAACAPAEDSPSPVTTETSVTTSAPTLTSSQPAPTLPTTSAPEPTPEEIAEQRVPDDERAKIASLLVVGVTDYDDALAKLRQGVGGIFIPSWADSRLLHEPGRDVAALREAVGRPFSVSIDFEGGRVQRHSQVLGDHPSPRELAATMSPQQVEEAAHGLGRTLRAHGITVDYAPVLDVDAAGLDVVGDRAFSADPWVAGDYGAAFARGLNRAGVAPVYKHFPGHGRASGDTHHVAAVTPPWPEVAAHDAAAWAVALEQRPAAVMVGHMIVPGLGEHVPASLNPEVYRVLREGDYPGGQPFAGLTYTDDLSGMRAITDAMSLPEAVARAIVAGADQALWSSGTEIGPAVDAVQHDLAQGEIAPEDIAAAAQRVQLQLVYAGL